MNTLFLCQHLAAKTVQNATVHYLATLASLHPRFYFRLLLYVSAFIQLRPH